MPSSYTESNSTNNTNGSSQHKIHQHGAVKSHHYVTAELQRQLEEKNDLITKLEVNICS